MLIPKTEGLTVWFKSGELMMENATIIMDDDDMIHLKGEMTIGKEKYNNVVTNKDHIVIVW